MGNRAVITTEDKKIGIYLHWNGGRDSVEGFLAYCKLKGHRSPDDDSYGWAYLCGVISNFFKDGLSVGIDLYECLDTDNGDNGVYIIKDWQIVGREYSHGEQKGRTLKEMLISINNSMPVEMQCSEESIENFLKNEGK